MSSKPSQITTPKFKANLKSDLCSYIKKTDFKIMTGPTMTGPISPLPFSCGSPDELSLAATFKNDSPLKEIYAITEENPYIEVPANTDTLECSFGPQELGLSRAERFFEMGNISNLSNKKEYGDKDYIYTVDTSARRDLKNSQTQQTQENYVKTLSTEVNQTVDRYPKDSFIDITHDQSLPAEQVKSKLLSVVNTWRPLMFFVFILFAVVFSGVASEYSIESPSFQFLALSIISLAASLFSFAIMKRTMFMKKFPKILSLWNKHQIDIDLYVFPKSYTVCQISSIILGLCLSAIVWKRDSSQITKAIFVLLLSIIVSCIAQIIFGLYYVHIFKKALKSARPKSFLGIRGVKKNVYNEFLDDLNDLKAQYSMTGKGEHVDTKPRKLKKTMVRSDSSNNLKQDKSSDTLRSLQTSKSELKEKDQVDHKASSKNLEVNYIPSMSLKHVCAGNLLILLWGFAGIYGLTVSYLIQNDLISNWILGFISVPGLSLFYGLLSFAMKRIIASLQIRGDLMLDFMSFAYMLIPYRMTTFVLLRQENSPALHILLFTLAKSIWKIAAYTYNFNHLKPKSEDEKTTDNIKKQKAEMGVVVELFKKKHLNFGVQITFWQHLDIMLSLVYIAVLPFVQGINMDRFVGNGIVPAISLVAVLGFDVIIEVILFRVFKYIFIKQGSELRKVNFSAMLYAYIRENLWIFMSSLFLVIYTSFNALSIQVSVDYQLY